MPNPDLALRMGDRLIIVGELKDLENLLATTNPRVNRSSAKSGSDEGEPRE